MSDEPIKMLSLDDPQFAEKFAEAIGLEPGETLEITGPQFERADGITPIANPTDVLHNLHRMPEKTLRALGMAPWDERLWLLPHEWFKHIPLGFRLQCIDGSEELFDPEKTSDDMRFGMLAYGIVPNFAPKDPANG